MPACPKSPMRDSCGPHAVAENAQELPEKRRWKKKKRTDTGGAIPESPLLTSPATPAPMCCASLAVGRTGGGGEKKKKKGDSQRHCQPTTIQIRGMKALTLTHPTSAPDHAIRRTTRETEKEEGRKRNASLERTLTEHHRATAGMFLRDPSGPPPWSRVTPMKLTEGKKRGRGGKKKREGKTNAFLKVKIGAFLISPRAVASFVGDPEA